jgi:hypothetical protein
MLALNTQAGFRAPRTRSVAASLAIVALAAAACRESPTSPQATSTTASLATDRSTGDTPNYNLEVLLQPCSEHVPAVPGCVAGDAGFGHVKFRQAGNDNLEKFDLGVWVRDLAPNAEYFLQRATDLSLDGSCTGTNWLTLGLGPAQPPQSITTDDKGTGTADLFRVVTNPVGTTFDIYFRVVRATANHTPDTNQIALESDCYQFSVK